MTDKFYRHIALGIPAPAQQPTSVNEMRVAIERAGRDSSLIRRCLDQGQYLGWSGEDKYAALAYYALLELERLWRVNVQFVNACPSPGAFVRPEVKPG